MNELHRAHRTGLICLGLAAAILAAYAPLWHCGFVLFDDNEYVTGNDMVRQGLTWPGIVWAFSTLHASNWHPLAWISHMLDCQLYGMHPAGHHATSLLLHIANSVLLFLLLQRMTQAPWRSALVAALFALHPLHVESVAWISERKDVLSAFFGILAVWAYVRQAEKKSAGWYLASLGLFALGLMAKPMLVTLPLVLILIDYWPLRRLRPPLGRLLAEKIPYFVLTVASCAVTMVAQRRGGAMASDPLGLRLANVPVAYARYLQKTVVPVDLAAYYPLPPHPWPMWEVAGAMLLLALATFFVVWRARAAPALIVGWFWFLGMLIPVIGLVHVGAQAMADRYDYLPGIGLFILIVWAVPTRVPAFWAGVVLAACLWITWTQVHYWQNSEILFRHALAVTSENSVMENDLGKVLLLDGRVDDALPHLERAVQFAPRYALPHYNLGQALLAKGQVAEALSQFEIQVALDPNDARAQDNFAKVLLAHGLAKDALPHLAEAVRLQPDNLQATTSLAWLLATNPDPSVRNGARALELARRADALTHGKDPKIEGILAAACAETGDFSDAVAAARRALQFADPNGALAAALRAQLEFYRAGQPFRDRP